MARLDDTRGQIDAGLAETAREVVGSRYLDLHADAVGVLGGASLGRLGADLVWRLSQSTSLYVEANALTDKTWNAGAGLRWRF